MERKKGGRKEEGRKQPVLFLTAGIQESTAAKVPGSKKVRVENYFNSDTFFWFYCLAGIISGS